VHKQEGLADSAPNSFVTNEDDEVMVKVLRVCANPRLVLCGYQEEGLERRVLVRVGRNMNFLPGMELKALRPDPNHQGGRPWQADMPDIPETGPAKPGGIFIRAELLPFRVTTNQFSVKRAAWRGAVLSDSRIKSCTTIRPPSASAVKHLLKRS
jgi:hypothetical protein